MRVAIIGAGWAGLTAAIQLYKQGHQVTVYEAAKQTGGRARQIKTAKIKSAIDNGQHILIGAYHSCFAVMASLDINPADVLHQQTLNIASADESLKFRFFNLPAPFNQLGIFLNSSGISGLHGRAFFIKLALELKHKVTLTDKTVHNWLNRLACPKPLLQRLWEPLCIATCNTSIQDTDANIFATVLRDGLLKRASDSDIYIPKLLLDDLWPAQAKKILADNIKYKFIRNIHLNVNNTWLINEQIFDKLIIATAFDNAKQLISQLPHAEKYLSSWPSLKFSAIGTLTLELERPWDYKHAMSLLFDNPEQNAWGQWLFNRNAIDVSESHRNLIHVVIGRAQRYAGVDSDIIAKGVTEQIRQQVKIELPNVLNNFLVTEKKATFDVVHGLSRPTVDTPWPSLFLAGDWTDTNYPAVLEGAVRSGLTAARHVLS